MHSDPMSTSATLHCWSWVQAASEVVPTKAELSVSQLILFGVRLRGRFSVQAE